MEQLTSFTANAWGWIILCGFVLGVGAFALVVVFIEHLKWKQCREYAKNEVERLARIMSVSEKLRNG